MIIDFAAGRKVEQTCILRLQKIGNSSNGGIFARGLLEDNSGCIPFICFEAGIVEKMRGLDAPKAFVVGGSVDINKFASDMSLQLILQKLEAVKPGANLSHLLPSGGLDLVALQKELDTLIAAVKDAGLSKLMTTIFSGATYERFIINPAGMRLHHAYIGGLMQHSVSVTKLALSMGKVLGEVDEDLLLAGALLHDLGKIDEISSDLGFPYTTEGRLLGHISLTAMKVYEAGRKISELSPEKLQELLHILLSHHGEQDKGSPVACALKESFIVHYADELDAVTNQFAKKHKSATWEYSKMLQRYLLLK